MDKKLIRNLECPADVADDSDYDSYVEDLKTGINKQYVNDHFLKKDNNDNYDLKKGSIIKNCEPYYDGLFDDNTLVSKEYVDIQDSKQDIPSNSQLIGNNTAQVTNNTAQLAVRADLTRTTVQTFAGRIQVRDFESYNHYITDVPNLRYVSDNYLNKNTGGTLTAIRFRDLKVQQFCC